MKLNLNLAKVSIGVLKCAGGMLFCGALASAQTRDRASLSYDLLPNASGIAARLTEVNANHRIMLDTDGASLLTVGMQYRLLELEVAGMANQDYNRQLQLVVPQFSLMHIVNDDYTMIINLRPGFFGDFKNNFGKSFRLEGAALVSRVINEKLTIGLGVGRGSSFGRDLTLPVLQILYLPSPTLMLDAVLPVKAELWYLPSRFWEFGGIFNILGSVYTVDNPLPGADRLGFANINLGIAARRLLLNSLYAHFETGYTFTRRYEWSEGREKIEETKPKSVPYVRAALNWRF
jgi:hypothetical protein